MTDDTEFDHIELRTGRPEHSFIEKNKATEENKLTGKFEDAYAGSDGFYLYFSDQDGNWIDFGKGTNNLGSYQFVVDDSSFPSGKGPNPLYVGKNFEIIWEEKDGIKSIISLKLIE